MKKVLLVQLGHLGDVLASRIALHALVSQYGAEQVEAVVSEPYASIFEYEPWPIRVHSYPRDWQNWRAVLKFLYRLRQEKPRLLVDVTGSTRSRWLALACFKTERWGWGRRWLYHQGTPDRRRPESNYSMEIARLLEDAGVSVSTDLPFLQAPPSPSGWNPEVVIHPGASNPIRHWRGDRFAELANALQKQGVKVSFLAGESERFWAEDLAKVSNDAPCRIPKDLPELMACLQPARLLIAVDSGPMHLAAALGVPVLALFGPNLSFRAGPVSGRVHFLEADLPCRPCSQKIEQCVSPQKNCMDHLEVQQVLKHTQQILGQIL